MISAVLLVAKVTLILTISGAAYRLSQHRPARFRWQICMSTLAVLAVAPFCGLRFLPDYVPALQETVSGSPSTIRGAQHSVPLLGLVWAAGAVAMAARFVLGMGYLARRMRSARPMGGKAAAVPVFFADVSTPLLCGLLRPSILLPRSAAVWSRKQTGLAVQHELAHLHGYDHWISFAIAIVQTMYWFHPLVWVLASRIRFEQELICDEKVLNLGASRTDYAELLVQVTREMRSPTLFSCSMGGAKRDLKGRIVNILTYRSMVTPGKWSRVALLSTFTMIGAAGLLMPVRMGATDSGPVYKVGEAGVSQPTLVTKIEPQYTEAAHDANIQGSALLSIVIDKAGVPGEVRIVRSLDSGLDQNAVEAVKQWRFEAAKKDGKPVAVRANIEVQFRLK